MKKNTKAVREELSSAIAELGQAVGEQFERHEARLNWVQAKALKTEQDVADLQRELAKRKRGCRRRLPG
jgi:predicted component of type VI protein secretion system